jgi:tetratricopeptide (TPR) repeat protein
MVSLPQRQATDTVTPLERADGLYGEGEFQLALRRYLEVAEALEATAPEPDDPARVEVARLWARAVGGAGNCLENLGRLGSAHREWRKALGILQSIGEGASAVASRLRATIASVDRHAVAFVSYARADHEIVVPVANGLAERGVRLLWDQDFLAGRPITELVLDAMARATSYVVFWSSQYALRPYCRLELEEVARLVNEDGPLAAGVAGRRLVIVGLDASAPPFEGLSEILQLRDVSDRRILVEKLHRALTRGES